MSDEDLAWRRISQGPGDGKLCRQAFRGFAKEHVLWHCEKQRSHRLHSQQLETPPYAPVSPSRLKLLTAAAPSPNWAGFLFYKQGNWGTVGEGWYPWNLMRWEAPRLAKQRTESWGTLLLCPDCPSCYRGQRNQNIQVWTLILVPKAKWRLLKRQPDFSCKILAVMSLTQFPQDNSNRQIWLWICLSPSETGGSSLIPFRLKGYYQQICSQENLTSPPILFM